MEDGGNDWGGERDGEASEELSGQERRTRMGRVLAMGRRSLTRSTETTVFRVYHSRMIMGRMLCGSGGLWARGDRW